MNKGVFMTFISVLIFLSLILFMFEVGNSYKYRRTIYEYDSHMSRLSYALDDLSTDLSEIYGVAYTGRITQNYTMQSFIVKKINRDPYLQLSDYQTYLNTIYRQGTHSNMTFSVNGNASEIYCDDDLFLLRNYTSNEAYVYLNDSSIYNASITLYVYSNYVNGIPWTEHASETPVYLRASSNTGTDINQLYYLRKTLDNRYLLNYTDGELNVEFGDVGKGTEGIHIWGSPQYDVNITVTMTANDSTSISCYHANSYFTYAQDIMNESGVIGIATISRP